MGGWVGGKTYQISSSCTANVSSFSMKPRQVGAPHRHLVFFRPCCASHPYSMESSVSLGRSRRAKKPVGVGGWVGGWNELL